MSGRSFLQGIRTHNFSVNRQPSYDHDHDVPNNAPSWIIVVLAHKSKSILGHAILILGQPDIQ